MNTQTKDRTQVKDLTKEAPASPAKRVGGYVILARLADKARARFLGGNIGEYHTGCPLDHALLDWKGIPYEDIKQVILGGAEDQALAEYLNSHGQPKTPEEIDGFSNFAEQMNPYSDPAKKDWYVGETSKLGLDAATTPMFKYLEADDRASH